MIGAGNVAQTYAGFWAAAGHEVMMGARNIEKALSAAVRLDPPVRAGSVLEAGNFGDVLLLATPFSAVDSAVDVIGVHSSGKIVLDATVPFGPSGGRAISEGELSAVILQAKLPLARVVKAFGTLSMKYTKMMAFREPPRLATPYAANREDDRHVVEELIAAIGFDALYIGTLEESRPIEPLSPAFAQDLTVEQMTRTIARFRDAYEESPQ